MVKNTTILYLLPALVMTAQPVSAETALTAEDVAAITESWKCKYCPDAADAPWYFLVDAGLGVVSNDSFRFGQYNGMNEEGPFLVLDFDAQYRNGEGNYFEARGDRLGLDSRTLLMEGGKQGTYRLHFVYDQVYKFDEDTARTPYDGSSDQTLPGGWVAAPITSGFTALNSTLQDADLFTERTNIKLGAKYLQSSNLSYELNYDHQAKEGRQTFGAAIGSNFALARSALLAKPLDYTTDQVELAANYRRSGFSSRIAFSNSVFRNADDHLRWDNAFTEPAGVTEGQAGTEPDNNMQQLMVTAGYTGIDKLNLSGYFSVARMTQDQDFLPYTINPALVTAALPRTSLDGEIIATTGTLKANWRLLPTSRLGVLYEYQDQDNNTDIEAYQYVTADTAIAATPRANVAYSFRTQKFKLDADHRFANKVKLDGGIRYTDIDRTFQEVDNQTETGLWIGIANSISSPLHARLKLETSKRSVDKYEQLTTLAPPENALTRKYNMADRSGDKAAVSLTYSGVARLVLNAEADYASYDYTDSDIGLTDLSESGIGFSAQYMLNKAASVTGYARRTQYESEQAGSQTVSTPDWYAVNDSTVTTAGIGANYQLIEDTLLAGVDYVYSRYTGEYGIDNATPFPDMTSTRHAVKIYADYTVDENMTVNVSYLFEQYDQENWQIDDVYPNTIDQVLTMGNVSPDYKIGVIWASLRYRF